MSHKPKKKGKKLAHSLKQLKISDPKPYTSPDLVFNTECDISSQWPKLKMKVPAIFIHSRLDLRRYVPKILQLGIQFYKPTLSTFYSKITCQTFNDHRNLTMFFDKQEIPYHTFGHPSKRKLKAVIRGLSNQVNVDKLKEEMIRAGLPVARLHIMKTNPKLAKPPLLMLLVVSYNEEGLKALQLINIFNHDVTIEPLQKKSKQCFRCQKWGHSQRYCHGIVKCVRCADDHFSKRCPKKRSKEPLKCSNCGGNHTASYRQCPYCPDSDVYKRKEKFKKITFALRKASSKTEELEGATASAKSERKTTELVTMENYDRLYRNCFYDSDDG